MRLVELPPAPAAEAWPALGLGTWRFGERAARRGAEVAAVRAALDMGYRLFDTAEMYGEGGAEQVIGAALSAALRMGPLVRGDVQLVSKCYPQHADPVSMAKACDASRRRLGVDCIDLYLLHWRGSVPLAQTIAGFQALQQRGWIRRWGVSNFALHDLLELASLPGGTDCATNQVHYSLGERGIEFDLLPWMRARHMPVMAYCPIDGGALARHEGLAAMARQRSISTAQLGLAWLLEQGDVIAIPKAVQEAHLRDNLASVPIALTAAERAEIDALFPPPRAPQPLAMV